jgi:hypothetical protein
MQLDDIALNPYNHLLYKSSYITVIPVCYAIYSKKMGYSISIGSVLCTSLLYWKKPNRGMRRNLDILVVNSVLIYHSYNAIGTKYYREHYFFNMLGILSYFLSWYFQYQNHIFISTIMHSFVHFFSNIGNIYLISG